MRILEQNPAPSIQQIVIFDSRNLKERDINKLFLKEPQRCFQVQQLKANSDLLKNYLFTTLLKVIQDWNHKVQNGQQDVNSRRELTRNTFLYIGLKKLLIIEERLRARELTSLFNWYCKNSTNRALTAYDTRNKNFVDDEWNVRKTFKHNMQLQVNNYRRRTFLSTQPSVALKDQLIKTIERSNEIVQNKKDSKCYFSHRLNHTSARKQRQMRQVSLKSIRFSQDRSRCNEARYKDYFKGRFCREDIWNQKHVLKKVNQYQGHQIINYQNVVLKRDRAIRTADSHLRYKGTPQTIQVDAPRSVDGLFLLKNPFEAPLKKKKRRR